MCIRDRVYLIVFAVFVFLVLAISPVISFNNRVLLQIHWPWLVEKALGVFRSSGRFAWPVLYMLYIGAIYWITKANKKRVAAFLLTFCLCFQLVDLKGFAQRRRNEIYAGYQCESPLRAALWDDLAGTYKHMVYLTPDYPQLTHNVGYALSYYALDNGMDMNAANVARVPQADLEEEVARQVAQIEQRCV